MPCENNIGLATKQQPPKKKRLDKVFKQKPVVSRETKEREQAKKLFGM